MKMDNDTVPEHKSGMPLHTPEMSQAPPQYGNTAQPGYVADAPSPLEPTNTHPQTVPSPPLEPTYTQPQGYSAPPQASPQLHGYSAPQMGSPQPQGYSAPQPGSPPLQGYSAPQPGSPGLEKQTSYPQHQFQQPQPQFSPPPQQQFSPPPQQQFSPPPQQQYPQQQQYAQQPMMQQHPGMMQQPVYINATPIANLGASAAPVQCPSCGQRAMTRTQSMTGNTTHAWAAGLCCLLLIGPVAYLIEGTKDVVHNCGNCGVRLATWHRSGRTEQHIHA